MFRSDSEEYRVFTVDKILKIVIMRIYLLDATLLHCYPTKRTYRLGQNITRACVHSCKLNLEEINDIKSRPIVVPTFSLHTQSCERTVLIDNLCQVLI